MSSWVAIESQDTSEVRSRRYMRDGNAANQLRRGRQRVGRCSSGQQQPERDRQKRTCRGHGTRGHAVKRCGEAAEKRGVLFGPAGGVEDEQGSDLDIRAGADPLQELRDAQLATIDWLHGDAPVMQHEAPAAGGRERDRAHASPACSAVNTSAVGTTR
jgi:hypothetical protein